MAADWVLKKLFTDLKSMNITSVYCQETVLKTCKHCKHAYPETNLRHVTFVDFLDEIRKADLSSYVLKGEPALKDCLVFILNNSKTQKYYLFENERGEAKLRGEEIFKRIKNE